MTTAPTFEELLADGLAAPVDGWDFSWFEGRATEERPEWGYARMLAGRLGTVTAALDIETGGGEVFAEALTRARRRPGVLAATESWPPNIPIAAQTLEPLGVRVAEVTAGGLPFPGAHFDLVVSRHPISNPWREIARVLRPGGGFLSQQIGAGSMRELTEALMGPRETSRVRAPDSVADEARAAGLAVVDLRSAALRTVFFDVGAVVAFLRKVVWIVPGFTVDRYRPQLAAIHDRIRASGPFVAHAQRFLIEARKPVRDGRPDRGSR
jgi:SAM-dependent methyltransferase